jgi:hypothetical protein
VYFLMSSSALSVADFIARWRAASSEAADLQQAVEDAGVDVLRQQRVEHARRRWARRSRAGGARRTWPASLALDDLERQQADDLGSWVTIDTKRV